MTAHDYIQDANVKIIRELRTEIKRLKSIITAAKLQDSDLIRTESALEENIQKKEEMVSACTVQCFWGTLRL